MGVETGTDPQIVELEPQQVAVVRATVPMAELTAFYDRAYHAVFAAVARQGMQPLEAPFGRYFGQPTDTVEIEAGVATARPVEPDGDVVPAMLPGGRVARVVHVGAYDGLGDSWRHLAEWIGAHGEQPGDSMWEQYLTEPGPDLDQSEMRTLLVWPLA